LRRVLLRLEFTFAAAAAAIRVKHPKSSLRSVIALVLMALL
jgi:hypothetical protein